MSQRILAIMRTRKPTVDRLETHRGQMADSDFKPIVRVGGELVLRLTGLCLFPCFLMGLVAQSLAGSASDEALRPKSLSENGEGSCGWEFWVGQGGERQARPPAVCSARTNAVQAGKTRRPEGLGGEGPLAALLVGHRPLRVCFLLAPCQSNPSLPNRTLPHFQTGSKPHPWALTARWENDSFADSDRYYTDGVSLSITRGGASALDPWIDRLPWSQVHRTLGFEIAQTVFTPKDTRRVVADPSDRPYAGVLALGLTVHLEGDEVYRGFKLMTGVLGPSSLADKTIRFVHQMGSWSEPRGWNSQLADEPILNLMHEYRHRYPLLGSGNGWEIQALPVAGLAVGNLLDEGYGGAVVRAGYRVPRDFGPTLLRGMGQLPPPAPERYGETGWGFAVHAGTQAHLVAGHDSRWQFVPGRSSSRQKLVRADGLGGYGRGK